MKLERGRDRPKHVDCAYILAHIIKQHCPHNFGSWVRYRSILNQESLIAVDLLSLAWTLSAPRADDLKAEAVRAGDPVRRLLYASGIDEGRSPGLTVVIVVFGVESQLKCLIERL